jgi:hypothetical protein
LAGRPSTSDGWIAFGSERHLRRWGHRVGYDLARYSTIFAYGDTREDAELLELATRRYYRWRELPAGGGVLRERLSTRPTR